MLSSNPYCALRIIESTVSQLRKVEPFKFNSWLMNIARLFIEDLAIFEHHLYICPPVRNTHVLSLFDLFFNRRQIHRIVYNAHVVVEIFSQYFLSDGQCECLGFFMIPHMTCDIPYFLSPIYCERELCEFIVYRFLILIDKSIVNPHIIILLERAL